MAAGDPKIIVPIGAVDGCTFLVKEGVPGYAGQVEGVGGRDLLLFIASFTGDIAHVAGWLF